MKKEVIVVFTVLLFLNTKPDDVGYFSNRFLLDFLLLNQYIHMGAIEEDPQRDILKTNSNFFNL